MRLYAAPFRLCGVFLGRSISGRAKVFLACFSPKHVVLVAILQVHWSSISAISFLENGVTFEASRHKVYKRRKRAHEKHISSTYTHIYTWKSTWDLRRPAGGPRLRLVVQSPTTLLIRDGRLYYAPLGSVSGVTILRPHVI